MYGDYEIDIIVSGMGMKKGENLFTNQCGNFLGLRVFRSMFIFRIKKTFTLSVIFDLSVLFIMTHIFFLINLKIRSKHSITIVVISGSADEMTQGDRLGIWILYRHCAHS